MEIPQIYYYYKGKTGNPMPNAIAVTIKDSTLYFSYQTLIAIENSDGLIVCKNIWTNTTGSHLNAIEPSESKRLGREMFLEEVKKRLEKI